MQGLTDIQYEVIIGSLLGDGSVDIKNKNPALRIMRQLKDKEYLIWEYQQLKDLCTSSGVKEHSRFDKRTNKTYYYCNFGTRRLPCLLDIYNNWYINKIKTIPLDLKLTSRIIAIWFADDGFLRIKNKSSLEMEFATHCFGKTGSLFLKDKLEEKYNKEFRINQCYNKKDQCIIKAYAQTARSLIKDIKPYILEMKMDRKLACLQNLPLESQI